MIQLPEDFISSLKEQFPLEAEAALKSISEGKEYHALRLKVVEDDAKEFLLKNGISVIKEVPFYKGAFYYDNETCAPGKHPLHEAGAYYIQEPSAMLPVSLLDISPSDKVLDLCAAPGGKSTQAASFLSDEGLIVSNEPHPDRCKVLSSNIERMGIGNAVVLNELPERLSGIFNAYFDKILVDAPCSGEGMFRKNPEAINEWSLENVKMCAERQRYILNEAAVMLRPGGNLVYSTCTFSKEENEDNVEWFLSKHPDYKLIRKERIWPHTFEGEGHFAALFKRKGEPTVSALRSGKASSGLPGDIVKQITTALSDIIKEDALKNYTDALLTERTIRLKDEVYLLPEGFSYSYIKTLKFTRPGLHLGTIKKGRFEPAHALVCSLSFYDINDPINLKYDDPRTAAFLRGESINITDEESGKRNGGYRVISVSGHPLGLSKQTNLILKNHYPKGLRKYF